MSNQALPASEWIGKAEVAKRLKVTERTALNLARGKKIKTKRGLDDHNQTAVLFHAGDVERFAFERENPTEESSAVVSARVERGRQQLMKPVFLGPVVDPQELRPWLTVKEAEAYTGLPASFILRLIEGQSIRSCNVGPRPGGKYRISKDALDDFSKGGGERS